MFTQELQTVTAKRLFHTPALYKLLDVYKIVFIFFMLLYCIDPDGASSIVLANDYLLTKVMIWLQVVVNLDAILVRFVGLFSTVEYEEVEEDYTPPSTIIGSTIDGISINELIVFLYERNGLPTIEARQKRNTTNDKIKKLGDNLERVGILGRGENNARVLKIQDVDTIISMLSVEDSDNIKIKPIQVSPTEYTLLPYSTAATL